MNLRQFQRILRTALLAPVLALLAMAAILYWQMHDANETVAAIQAANLRIGQVADLERLMIDEETGLRGYQLTNDPAFLEPYTTAHRQVDTAIAALRANTRTTKGKEDTEKLVSDCMAWRTEFVGPFLAMQTDGPRMDETALNVRGKQLMDAIRQQSGLMIHNASTRRDERVAQWHGQVWRTQVVLAFLALGVGLAIGLFVNHRLHEVSNAYKASLNILRLRSEEIFRSEQHLRTTLASIGDGVITCDKEGRVLTMNPVAEQLTGWAEQDARTLALEQIFDILSEDDHQPAENPAAKVLRLNRIVALTNHSILRRRDGTEIWIDDSGAPIRDQRGELAGVVLVFRDVTMQRKSQSALVANEKLAVAGRLAATIAHEIHNPLDSVANLLFLLEGTTNPEESHQFLQLARQELARVTQISRAMLGLYRESREPVPIELRALLESVMLLMERRFADLAVDIRTELPDGLDILGYPAELRQVFTNLLTNAAEAASIGGAEHPFVRLSAQPTPAAFVGAVDGVTLTLADNGPGIPDIVREKLFQPFFTTKAENGTGLGLWISQGIVSRHGGSIRVESDTTPANHGTRVIVFIAARPTATKPIA